MINSAEDENPICSLCEASQHKAEIYRFGECLYSELRRTANISYSSMNIGFV